MNAFALYVYQRLPYSLKCLIASYKGDRLRKIRQWNRDEIIQEVRERDSWTREELEIWQKQQLNEMLEHAVKNVPYYRNLWNGAGKDDYLDLSRWPVLKKEDIRNNPELFISDEHKNKRLIGISTSGTSGTPMKHWFDTEAISRWYAIYEHRIRNWHGVSELDRWANFGGQLIVPTGRSKRPYWIWNSAMKQLYLSSYHISPKTAKDYISALKKYRIKYILGYVSSIYNLSREGIQQGIQLPKMKLVITNAEPLLDHQRELISKAFGCKVVQTYSGSELAFGGNECSYGSMHLWPEAGILEVVDKNDLPLKSSQLGSFVITGFLNKAMPLIRYKIGDTGAVNASLNQCDCGRNLLSIDKLEGRTDDLLIDRNGNYIGRLDPVFKADIRIKAAQIIQHSVERIELKIIPDVGYSSKDVSIVTDNIKHRMGPVDITISVVDQIPLSSNGKFKAVISQVNSKK